MFSHTHSRLRIDWANVHTVLILWYVHISLCRFYYVHAQLITNILNATGQKAPR